VSGVDFVTGALHSVKALQDLSVVGGHGPGFLYRFTLIALQPKGAAVASSGLEVQVLNEALNFWEFPISTSGWPLDGYRAAVFVALQCYRHKGAPYPLELANMLFHPF